MSKRFIVLFGLILLLNSLLVGCSGKSLETQADQENIFAVEVMKPSLGDISQSITLSGQLQAIDTVTVIPEIQGLLEVKTLAVQLGDFVRKGDVLFTLDTESVEDQVSSRKLSYETNLANYKFQKKLLDEQIEDARLTYENAKKSYENAKINFERIEKLFEAGGASQQDYEQAKLSASDIPYQQAKLSYENKKASETQLQYLEAQLEETKLAYNNSSKDLNNTIITAPIDGIVSSIDIQEKGLISAQPALTITDISSLEVVMKVTEATINKIMAAGNVQLMIPSISDEIVIGSIKAVNPVPDPVSQLYTVKVTVENPEDVIKPGMFAQVYIHTNEKSDIVTLPSAAVLQEDKDFYVFLVKEERAVRKAVEIGLDNGELVEITAGLAPEDAVIVKGQDFLKDGYKIKIVRGEF
ncbi:RND family efflux transporter, MFP subunit [Anaerovirgula multivorans]|uniref:RND family efflux transporter, MFP subunit n=1 Tax=Anaerovirgula multivorans TaxID=312168 RepID=A0A239HF36_9FIRM|nr:efflux RND transporter periplasmic adaptor subunit [Anaerovirgula multivorans]SNS79765.1 RND family efflux transporter, MFP subunit [Anaerovirgula multivorans]